MEKVRKVNPSWCSSETEFSRPQSHTWSFERAAQIRAVWCSNSCLCGSWASFILMTWSDVDKGLLEGSGAATLRASCYLIRCRGVFCSSTWRHHFLLNYKWPCFAIIIFTSWREPAWGPTISLPLFLSLARPLLHQLQATLLFSDFNETLPQGGSQRGSPGLTVHRKSIKLVPNKGKKTRAEGESDR